MHVRGFVAWLAAAVIAASSNLAPAQDDEGESDEPLRCVAMASIRSTRVVDDSTVLFYHGRGRIYVNRLERECVGLTRNGKFTYELHTGARHARLCATDSITVLERTGRGFNCGLGMFEPISQESADTFISGPNRAVTSTQVELSQPEAPVAPTAPSPEPVPEQ
jgi:hypothetical protein